MDTKKIYGWIGALAVFTFVGVSAVSADDYTGNPATNGWQLSGNSLAIGTYIRGVANLPFDVYSDAFTITTNSPLWDGTLLNPNSGDWHPGDQVLGLGGIMTTNQFFLARLVAKFGSASSDFSASTLASPNGNGNGSFSGGDAGLGGVQIDYQFTYNSASNHVTPAFQNGQILLPDHVLYDDGITLSGTNLDTNFGAILATFHRNGSSQDVLVSFEVALDLTALVRAGLGTQIPKIDGLEDMAVQTVIDGSPDTYTDGLVNETIPEPSTSSLLLASAAALGWFLKPRRRTKVQPSQSPKRKRASRVGTLFSCELSFSRRVSDG